MIPSTSGSRRSDLTGKAVPSLPGDRSTRLPSSDTLAKGHFSLNGNLSLLSVGPWQMGINSISSLSRDRYPGSEIPLGESLTGISIWKTAPLPSAVRTRSVPIFPFMLSTRIFWHIHNPRPEPPNLPDTLASACANFPNILPWASCVMPGPESCTSIESFPTSLFALPTNGTATLMEIRAVIVTDVFDEENLMALLNRLTNTWHSLAKSPNP
mmetsp:Transcript_3052/g.5333  ORF Transcript_3052/g.5333 Transcript_3052/m.5333 type:complete len:212 (+) Transcript_3052:660-1295(+)